ncbi:hypothetical protein [Belnapia rosea]|uniref:hypothetical protein n=1 Tax=Belnapia rosea TaxID=938405 RepID=UPI0015A29D67|nr:hypothetical protein [Belnapia rosea]
MDELRVGGARERVNPFRVEVVEDAAPAVEEVEPEPRRRRSRPRKHELAGEEVG